MASNVTERETSPLRLVGQKRAAAETLFRNGHRAEGWRLARAASDVAGLTIAPEVPLVALDEAIKAEHEQAFEAVLRGLRTWEKAQAPGRWRPTRSSMLAFGAVIGVAAGFGAWFALRTPQPVVEARASASWSGSYKPFLVLDGFPRTEWLLPDGQKGWLELHFPAPRAVARLRLLNSRNLPHLDRATSSFRVSAFRGDEAVWTDSRRFPPLTGIKHYEILKVEQEGITRLRVEVLGHYRKGAGLAELVVE